MSQFLYIYKSFISCERPYGWWIITDDSYIKVLIIVWVIRTYIKIFFNKVLTSKFINFLQLWIINNFFSKRWFNRIHTSLLLRSECTLELLVFKINFLFLRINEMIRFYWIYPFYQKSIWQDIVCGILMFYAQTMNSIGKSWCHTHLMYRLRSFRLNDLVISTVIKTFSLNDI